MTPQQKKKKSRSRSRSPRSVSRLSKKTSLTPKKRKKAKLDSSSSESSPTYCRRPRSRDKQQILQRSRSNSYEKVRDSLLADDVLKVSLNQETTLENSFAFERNISMSVSPSSTAKSLSRQNAAPANTNILHRSVRQDSLDSGLSSVPPTSTPPGSSSLGRNSVDTILRTSLVDCFENCPLCRASIESHKREEHFQRHGDEMFLSIPHKRHFTNIQSAIFSLLEEDGLDIRSEAKSKVFDRNLIKFPKDENRCGFHCETCDEHFYRDKAMRLHRKRCKGSFIVRYCRFCDEVFDSEEDFVLHCSHFGSGNISQCFPVKEVWERIRQGIQQHKLGTTDGILQPKNNSQKVQTSKNDSLFANVEYKNAYAGFSDASPAEEAFSCYETPHQGLSPAFSKFLLLAGSSTQSKGAEGLKQVTLPQTQRTTIVCKNESLVSPKADLINLSDSLTADDVSVPEDPLTGHNRTNELKVSKRPIEQPPKEIPKEMLDWVLPVPEGTLDGRGTLVLRSDIRKDPRKEFPNYGGKASLIKNKMHDWKPLECGESKNMSLAKFAPKKLRLIPLDIIHLQSFTEENPFLCGDFENEMFLANAS